LEEELLSIKNSLMPPKATKQQQESHAAEEKEELEPPQEDGWLEVGKKNRTIITRTVSILFKLHSHSVRALMAIVEIKAVESPITRIFGGKFKSTLKAPGQKDSVLVEDWISLRLDIQVRIAAYYPSRKFNSMTHSLNRYIQSKKPLRK
jgi:ubiquitin carboxyl-terminal hydrolase 10